MLNFARTDPAWEEFRPTASLHLARRIYRFLLYRTRLIRLKADARLADAAGSYAMIRRKVKRCHPAFTKKNIVVYLYQAANGKAAVNVAGLKLRSI